MFSCNLLSWSTRKSPSFTSYLGSRNAVHPRADSSYSQHELFSVHAKFTACPYEPPYKMRGRVYVRNFNSHKIDVVVCLDIALFISTSNRFIVRCHYKALISIPEVASFTKQKNKLVRLVAGEVKNANHSTLFSYFIELRITTALNSVWFRVHTRSAQSVALPN